MAIDTHMHLNNYLLDKEDVFKHVNILNNDAHIEKAINVGINLGTSRQAIDLTKTSSKLYASVGIHPKYILNQNIEEIFNVASINSDKIVAIGESGFDINSNVDYKTQRSYFIAHILLANSLKLPLIIHSNGFNLQVVEILKSIHPRYGCVFHDFEPDIPTLNYLIEQGYYISFTSKITYPFTNRHVEIANYVPDNLFLLETDSPSIPPSSLKGAINCSSNIKYCIAKLAEIKGMTYEELETLADNNAKTLFKKLK